MAYKFDRGPKANKYCPVCYHALPPDLAEAYRHRSYKSHREFESIIYALMEADPHGRWTQSNWRKEMFQHSRKNTATKGGSI